MEAVYSFEEADFQEDTSIKFYKCGRIVLTDDNRVGIIASVSAREPGTNWFYDDPNDWQIEERVFQDHEQVEYQTFRGRDLNVTHVFTFFFR